MEYFFELAAFEPAVVAVVFGIAAAAAVVDFALIAADAERAVPLPVPQQPAYVLPALGVHAAHLFFRPDPKLDLRFFGCRAAQVYEAVAIETVEPENIAAADGIEVAVIAAVSTAAAAGTVVA